MTLRLFLTICLVVSLGGCPDSEPAPSGAEPTNGDTGTPVDARAAELVGLNAHLPDDETLDRLASAGVQWVRLAMVWRALEVEDDVIFWDYVDDRVAAVRAKGMRILMTVVETPAWASDSGAANAVPRNADDWADFMTRAVQRYKDDIHYWGLWNEPNGGDGEYWAGTAEQYRDVILKPGAQAAKQADPAAQVVAPGITIHTDWSDWMEPIFAEGGADAIDIVAVHLYVTGDADDLLYNVDRRNGSLGDITPLGNMLEELDVMDKPCWMLETGWATGGEHAVSEPQQAERLHGTLWGLYQREIVNKVFVYCVIDDLSGGGGNYYGLLNEDHTPKPAFTMLAEFLAAPAAPE
jgi:hypothetical protein